MTMEKELNFLMTALEEIAVNTKVIADVLCEVYGFVAVCDACDEDEDAPAAEGEVKEEVAVPEAA